MYYYMCFRWKLAIESASNLLKNIISQFLTKVNPNRIKKKMNGPSKSSVNVSRSETIVLTDPSIPRARKWMLTTANPTTAPATPTILSTSRIDVFLGPVETSVGDTNAHQHGIACVRQLDGQAQATALNKEKILKELRLLGLEQWRIFSLAKTFVRA